MRTFLIQTTNDCVILTVTLQMTLPSPQTHIAKHLLVKRCTIKKKVFPIYLFAQSEISKQIRLKIRWQEYFKL